MPAKGRCNIRWWLIAAIAILSFIFWSLFAAFNVSRDAYAQWATAELIATFHSQYHRWPDGWQDLREIYGEGEGFHTGPNSFEDIVRRTIVEFPRLNEMEHPDLVRQNSGTSREVIRPRSGRQSCYSGAEPNDLLIRYVSEPEEVQADMNIKHS